MQYSEESETSVCLGFEWDFFVVCFLGFLLVVVGFLILFCLVGLA